jgi:arsenate reductase (thioredoxin)
MENSEKIKVLFVCVHNSARSQMAQAYLEKLASDRFSAKSAGIEPGELNPLAIEAMKEEGIDISKNETKSVFDFYKKGTLFNYVISVCDEATAEKCPIFPGHAKRLHWSLEDPASFEGTWKEKLQKTRGVRDKIKQKVEEFIKESG